MPLTSVPGPSITMSSKRITCGLSIAVKVTLVALPAAFHQPGNSSVILLSFRSASIW